MISVRFFMLPLCEMWIRSMLNTNRFAPLAFVPVLKDEFSSMNMHLCCGMHSTVRNVWIAFFWHIDWVEIPKIRRKKAYEKIKSNQFYCYIYFSVLHCISNSTDLLRRTWYISSEWNRCWSWNEWDKSE